MIFAIHHGYRSAQYDPVHTPEGILQVISLDQFQEALQHALASLKIKLIVSGTGRRFREICSRVAQPMFPFAPVIYTSRLGDATSVDDKKNAAIIDRDFMIPLPCFRRQKDDYPPEVQWEYVVNRYDALVLGDKLFCTGRDFLASLGCNETKSGAVYEINPKRHTVSCIFESGKIQWST